MNKKELRLRAHHGMCLAFFEGKGYSAGFTAHMQGILERLEQENPSIVLVAAADCICSGCPNLTDGLCETADLVQNYDRQVLSLCSLRENDTLHWQTFSALVAERILSQGKRADICGNCQWATVCNEKEALYRL